MVVVGSWAGTAAGVDVGTAATDADAAAGLDTETIKGEVEGVVAAGLTVAAEVTGTITPGEAVGSVTERLSNV